MGSNLQTILTKKEYKDIFQGLYLSEQGNPGRRQVELQAPLLLPSGQRRGRPFTSSLPAFT